MTTKPQSESKTALIIIMVLPIAIILLSTFVFFTGIGAPDGTKNQGDLINPARSLQDANVPFSVPEGQRKPLWTLVQVGETYCAEQCLESLRYSRQMHKSLGRRTPGLRRQYWHAEGTELSASQMEEFINLEQVALPETFLTLTNDLPKARYYLIDPRGFLMMQYNESHDYKQMIKDLKFLLTQSGY